MTVKGKELINELANIKPEGFVELCNKILHDIELYKKTFIKEDRILTEKVTDEIEVKITNTKTENNHYEGIKVEIIKGEEVIRESMFTDLSSFEAILHYFVKFDMHYKLVN